ncbi:hypothetical protein AMES_3535 [Amycolatopsis mediterranei S699]|uniref:Uncharacterized protein n=2 Tax=Amycolatopsis mediterranei TaxID=33910 RepID=A0A0H3D338_AMYMU|nr:hypothetical protein AMED_3574 [Amycolatopsis mediterranei U32]AFO77071.1 hypothetical protein AMES_3535 [Amycolatopsis mediterranei S699]AGT84199.1 hypothetical protein B737_3535 [Amycolatopsis mediterranei RB]KDO08476.1 hypothetical protein DV26_23250 [Amycolatopsis mediterranei]KDU89084.1 hypothetical protein DV36_27170 [Amycolatopsis mediterranei]
MGMLFQRIHGEGSTVQRQSFQPSTGAPPTLEPPAVPLEGMPPEVFELPPLGSSAARAAERAAVDAAASQAERVVAERAVEEVVVQVGERIVSRRLLAGLTAVAIADEWNPVGWFLDGVIVGLLIYDAVEGYQTIRTSAQTRPAQSPPSAEAPGATSGVRIVDPVPVRPVVAPQAGPSAPVHAPGTGGGAPVTEPATDATPLEAARRADPELDRLMDIAITLQLEVGAVPDGSLVTAVSRGGPRTQSRRDRMSSPMIQSIRELMSQAGLLNPRDGTLPFHAEKKMVVQWGGPFAVNQNICPNCWQFLRWFAGTMGRRIVVADPAGVHVITPNGGFLTGPLVVRIPASR